MRMFVGNQFQSGNREASLLETMSQVAAARTSDRVAHSVAKNTWHGSDQYEQFIRGYAWGNVVTSAAAITGAGYIGNTRLVSSEVPVLGIRLVFEEQSGWHVQSDVSSTTHT